MSFLKKGKHPKDVNSYRPISLLNSGYKLLMKIWVIHTTLLAQALIYSEQSAFVAGRLMAATPVS